VVNPQQPLNLFPTLVCDGGVLVLLVDDVVAGVFLGLSRRLLDFLALIRWGTTRLALSYLSVDSSLAPLMISGVRASSIRIESTSSTMPKLCPRCTHSFRSNFMLSRR